MKFKTIAFSLVCLFLVNMFVFATPLSTKLKDAKSNLAESRDNYEEACERLEGVGAQIETLDENLGEINEEINKFKANISVLQEKIGLIEKQIEIDEKNVEKGKDIIRKRFKYIYMNDTSYASVLLGSEGINDFLNKAEIIAKLSEQDKKVIKAYRDDMNKLKKEKEELASDRKELIALKDKDMKKAAEYREKKKRQLALLDDLRALEQKYAKEIALYRAEVAKIQKAIMAALNKGKYTSANALLKYAFQFIGTPYQWGANGPDRFDCSGFTRYVYKHFGINLPRVSRDQAKVGQYITKANVKPGDLVFYGHPVHHVGIYVGNGMYINAPYTGAKVRLDNFNRKDFNCARRFSYKK